jgi:hypothetical protein
VKTNLPNLSRMIALPLLMLVVKFMHSAWCRSIAAVLVLAHGFLRFPAAQVPLRFGFLWFHLVLLGFLGEVLGLDIALLIRSGVRIRLRPAPPRVQGGYRDGGLICPQDNHRQPPGQPQLWQCRRKMIMS